jgi:hypothetical protein
LDFLTNQVLAKFDGVTIVLKHDCIVIVDHEQLLL